MKKILFICSVFLIFTSCLTTGLSERGDVSEMLVGKLVLTLDKAVDAFGNKVSGEFESNVRLSLKHVQTGKTYIQFTDQNGFFAINEPLQGDYIIEYITVENKSSDSPVTVFPVIIPFSLDEESECYSLDELLVVISDGKKVDANQKLSLDDFKKKFESFFPGSDWLEAEWSVVTLKSY